MTIKHVKSAILAVVAAGFAGSAFADCAGDMAKLDSALKSASLSAQARTDLGNARSKAADLLKAHDEKGCSKAIMDANAKAGVKM